MTALALLMVMVDDVFSTYQYGSLFFVLCLHLSARRVRRIRLSVICQMLLTDRRMGIYSYMLLNFKSLTDIQHVDLTSKIFLSVFHQTQIILENRENIIREKRVSILEASRNRRMKRVSINDKEYFIVF